ncbi:fumarylacetoacetate hydrolase family protein [Nocardia goodfellowii]|uniref:2-keto-4-pentenoate hydratase/2-oxohepta-3-ene-1,7-dioic acid hydratase in catechol pathway n=1 Tax=Nocardia goodfellowii TaxID=882446 RepID=A0ABS4QK90_9NOCA|nr:fumarylacetoacetate hydrolase family protein [Nocardia goodfellowii]MBP2192124.1 2-keto-4-pentenoate hydratase/2-oxohepta-3-ene-1,7-dioic acid hydratase in catechol pathway [Nocardia goodfellowii]
MRLAVLDGDRAAIVTDTGVHDITDLLPTCAGPSGGPWLPWLERGGSVADLAALDLSRCPAQPLATAALRAPLPRPGKIVAAPVNYLDHKVEMREQKTIAEYGVFLKANTSVIGPGDTVELPYTDKRTDQEGELAVVIGRTARHVPVRRALDHVFGYTGVLDITVRSTEDRSTRKSFDTFTPLGPWIVTADEVGDPGTLPLRCWVDGELRQHTNTSELIFSVAELVAYASSVMTLHPGDVIATGTPAGVGPLRHGSSIRLEIGRIGTLEVGVSARHAIDYADRPGAHLDFRAASE